MKQHLQCTFGAIVLALLMLGCAPNANSINKHPDKYDGKQVKIVGVIKQLLSIPAKHNEPAMTLYQITDNSAEGKAGMIWVLRGPDSAQKGIVPNINNRITIQGAVAKEKIVGNVSYSPVIIEKSSQEEIPNGAPGNF